MVDYSKWDKFDISDSEEEEEPRGPPQVTKLDNPSSVQFGGSTDQPTVLPPAPPAAATAATPTPSPPLSTPPTTNGGKFTHTRSTLAISWSQTKDELDIYLPVPNDTAGPSIAVNITNALSFRDRASAIGSSNKQSISVSIKKGALTIPHLPTIALPHPVYVGDEDDAESLSQLQPDWEMATFGSSRYVKITLKKAVPMAGMTLWWKTCVTGGDEIDVQNISERVRRNAPGAGGGGAPKLNMQETWDEAHRMFREKMKVKAKENPKQEIEVPDDDGKPAFPTLSN